MFFSKKIIGIDIGVGSIKVVEISRSGKRKNLLNYGELKSEFINSNAKENTLQFSNDSIAKAIRAILNEAGIKTKEVIFSVPDFLTFFTSFEIPRMTEREIPGAVQYNASQFVTLPISEVTLDWQVMKKDPNDKNSPIRVLLVAIPNKLIQNYQIIAKLAGLDLYALEAEAFGLTRALTQDDRKVLCLIDIGVQTSTINITEGNYLRRSYSFDFSSNKIDSSISSILKIDKKSAENLKIKEGLLSKNKNSVDSILNLVDVLISEVRVVMDNFTKEEARTIEKIYLTGGTSNMPGLKEYFKEKFNKEVFIPNCFSGISYPAALEKIIVDLAPRFSAAVGVALFGLQNNINGN